MVRLGVAKAMTLRSTCAACEAPHVVRFGSIADQAVPQKLRHSQVIWIFLIGEIETCSRQALAAAIRALLLAIVERSNTGFGSFARQAIPRRATVAVR